jgi:hypothetical protein
MVFMDNQVENKEAQKLNSRRKFLLGAAKAAPVVTSMAALPVWADNASISGNLSGNLSGKDREHGSSYADGCSPGYYHMHTQHEDYSTSGFNLDSVLNTSDKTERYITHYEKGGGKTRVIFFSDNSKIGSVVLYKSSFQSVFGIGYGPDAPIYKVLNPSLWDDNPVITQIDRMALTAYLNAHETYSGAINSYGNHSFPYSTSDITEFYQRYKNGSEPVISDIDATNILDNLIHGGGQFNNWDSLDARCL